MKWSKAILLLFCLSTQFLFAQSSIERVEPPNWWVDMENPNLQLMIYGKNIGDLNPSINYEGVHIAQVRKVQNANYLFIDVVTVSYTHLTLPTICSV